MLLKTLIKASCTASLASFLLPVTAVAVLMAYSQ